MAMCSTLICSVRKVTVGIAVVTALAAPALVVLTIPSVSDANPSFLHAFEETYVASTLPQDMDDLIFSSCYVCHNPQQFFGDLNCYRRDLAARLRAGRDIYQAMADIEQVDSDGDGVNNITEILAPRGNGQIGYNPGFVGPTGTDPCFRLPNQPITNRSETPVIGPTCFVDYNNDGFLNQEDLSGYLTAFLDEAVPAGPSGTSSSPCPGEPAAYATLGYAADFNRDCSFNQEDLAGFITEYFQQSESPSGCVPG